jgi:hypothetical protein
VVVFFAAFAAFAAFKFTVFVLGSVVAFSRSFCEDSFNVVPVA